MMAVTDVITVAPGVFLIGLLIGFWIGGRFIIRKQNGDEVGGDRDGR